MNKEICHNFNVNKGIYKWRYILRQLLVNSGVWTSYFILGLSGGAPTVLIPQLRNENNSSDAVTPEQASWLPSVFIYSGLPCTIILFLISAFAGRKICFIIVCTSSCIGFTIFYCSSEIRQIIISEVFQGILAASNVTVAIIICTEYTSPKNRGIFSTIKSASFYWGILVANTIGTYFHWKNIPLLGLICVIYCLIGLYFWPESPYWLARKGRIEECINAHRWLRGSCRNAEKDLENLINNNENLKRNISLMLQAIDSVKIMVEKRFYKGLLLFFLLKALEMLSGKLVCTIYAIEIFKKMYTHKSTVYSSMLILDSVTVVSMYVGCILAKIFRRRTLLLTFSIISQIFLFSLSIYLYLVKLCLIPLSIYISLALFIGFSMAISCGPLILSATIAAEILPLESRNLALCITALFYKLINGTFIKISPYIFHSLDMHGTFLFFGVGSAICLMLIYFYLPETKDKTLQEIAESIQGIRRINYEVEAKELLPIIHNDSGLKHGKEDSNLVR